jgi:hypothetical protein
VTDLFNQQVCVVPLKLIFRESSPFGANVLVRRSIIGSQAPVLTCNDLLFRLMGGRSDNKWDCRIHRLIRQYKSSELLVLLDARAREFAILKLKYINN